MAKLTILQLDQNGNEVFTDYDVHEDILDYIKVRDEELAILMAKYVVTDIDYSNCLNIIEAYQNSMDGREVLN